MTSASETTTDHDEIRQRVDEHDGRSATVSGTGSGAEPKILRIDVPGGAGEDRLEPIEWDEWLDQFDEFDLAFLYQEHRAGGDDSTCFKLGRR